MIDSLLFEKNVVIKNIKKTNLRFGLCYPNVYKTAMSSLGYNILYDYLNTNPNIYCERIIYPETRSIETKSRMNDFDILSFTIHYEQDYFNVVEMLKKADIPIHRQDRSENDPIIIAGGPCVSANPKPLTPFIDLFAIGEGEVILNSIIKNYLKNGKDIKSYLPLKGVYTSKYDNYTKIQLVEDMNQAHHITNPIIWENTIFKDSIMLNVSRGCTRGCRFCMTGYTTRPQRETKIDKLMEIACKLRENTNLNKVTLIGAAVSDYTNITKLINNLLEEGFEISTPSLRLESITRNHLENLAKSNLKTITLAPETIYKLRKSINKDVSDEKIFEIIKNAFDLNFNVKLYFLIGLPHETIENIYELTDFMKKLASFKKSNKITFSINPLIPKPHTPLQWHQYNLKDIKKKTRIIKKEMNKYNIKTESPKQGLIQYILSCGDYNVSTLIEKDHTTLKEWRELKPNYNFKSKLPWDNIDVGVSKKFLKKEAQKIETSTTTPWCNDSKCSNCGVCKKT